MPIPETDARADCLTGVTGSGRSSRRVLVGGWSVNVLAQASSVLAAMIARSSVVRCSRRQRCLARLSGALGMTLSELIASAEGTPERVARRRGQQVWRDPETGYVRRAVSPSASAMLQLVEVELPCRGRVSRCHERATCSSTSKSGCWRGDCASSKARRRNELGVGDCLQLGDPQNCVFENPANSTCRYLVALRKR